MQRILSAINRELAAPLKYHQRHIHLVINMLRNAVAGGQANEIRVELFAVHAPDRAIIGNVAQCRSNIDTILRWQSHDSFSFIHI